MFNSFSSSSSEDTKRKFRKTKTRIVTIAFLDAHSYSNVTLTPDTESSTSSSSTSLLTPSSHGSAQRLLDQLDRDKEKSKYFGYHPIWREMSLNDGPKLKTLEYLLDSNVFQLFNFLMTHLLVHSPEDPVPFLVSLVDRCIRYRDEHEDPPLVFEDGHIHSVYVALDPLLEGSITYSQYLVGMQTLGLTEFNVLPNEMESHKDVAKDVFIKEAKTALVMQLDKILAGKTDRCTEDEIEMVTSYTNLPSKS